MVTPYGELFSDSSAIDRYDSLPVRSLTPIAGLKIWLESVSLRKEFFPKSVLSQTISKFELSNNRHPFYQYNEFKHLQGIVEPNDKINPPIYFHWACLKCTEIYYTSCCLNVRFSSPKDNIQCPCQNLLDV